MSLVSKKPLIKQQTIYDGQERAKTSKMSLPTKRVSFHSTTIQSDSDEENSLDRSNRKPVQKPNGDDDDLLNMFRSELSDSEDDVLQTRSKVKSKGVDKPNPVPRHTTRSTSAAGSVGQPADETILHKSKAKPRPQPRRSSGSIQSSEEGSPRSSKPEVTPRKLQSGSRSTADYEQNRRKTKTSDYHSDNNDDVDHKLSRFGRNGLRESSVENRKLRKQSSEEDEYIGKDIVHSSSKTPDESSYSMKELTKEQDERIKGKSFGGEYVDKEDTNFDKKHSRMVPAPKPRKHIQDGLPVHDDTSDDDDDDNIDVRKKLKNTPVPKARKEHFVEFQDKETVFKSQLSKSRLHPLDVVDDDDSDDDDDDDDGSEKTRKKMIDREKMLRGSKNRLSGDKVDGRTKKEENTLDWSSLDESDDETLGKKVNLFKKERPTSAKTVRDDNNNSNKEMNKEPKLSPRPKPRKGLGNMNVQQEWQSDTSKNAKNSTDYDSYQRVPREQGERSTHGRRTATPQRHGSSSKAQSNTGWGRDREDAEDITDMFEDHFPDADDLIGGDHRQLFQPRRDQLKQRSSVTPKKGPMKADQGIEAMTRSPHLRQTLRHTEDNQDWGYLSQPSSGKQKSSSLTNLHRTGDSDYGYYDDDDDDDDGPRRNSLDTETIRQTVYDNWLSRKNVTIKKELSKKALEKQKEEEKRKEEEERKRNAQLAFQSWNQRKTETLKEQHSRLKTKQKEDQEKKELEKQLKVKDSKKYFESWKSKKDELIKETHKEKKKENKMKKKKEEEEKFEKMTSSKKSFENWKSKKDTILKQQLREKKTKEKVVEAKKEEENYEKTIKNADEFQKWVENKGKPRKGLTPPKLTQRAWVPGSRNMSDSCIPPTVQPVILPPSTNRARTMSGTYRGKTKYYDF